jgi:hypothetical protein
MSMTRDFLFSPAELATSFDQIENFTRPVDLLLSPASLLLIMLVPGALKSPTGQSHVGVTRQIKR